MTGLVILKLFVSIVSSTLQTKTLSDANKLTTQEKNFQNMMKAIQEIQERLECQFFLTEELT